MAWIKFDKSLVDDPRILRAAALLADQFSVVREFEKGGSEDLPISEHYALMRNAVTGALCVLWSYADTHIRDGDVLPISAFEVDRLVGIEGFCEAIGDDWVQLTPEQNHVILPGYIDKNGLISREKRAKSNAERQRAFREKAKTPPKKTKPSSNGVTRGTVTARDLDQDLDLDSKNKKAAAELLEGVDEAAWKKWLAYRKQIGRPLKEASLLPAQQKLADFGVNQMASVEQSIANGWQGLFNVRRGGNGGEKPETANDRIERALARRAREREGVIDV